MQRLGVENAASAGAIDALRLLMALSLSKGKSRREYQFRVASFESEATGFYPVERGALPRRPTIPESSSSRTPGFESGDRGANPRSGAILDIARWRNRNVPGLHPGVGGA